jgi:hypothetical protein
VDPVLALGWFVEGGFRPPEEIRAVRTLWRHRGSLLQIAPKHILHKSLREAPISLVGSIADCE